MTTCRATSSLSAHLHALVARLPAYVGSSSIQSAGSSSSGAPSESRRPRPGPLRRRRADGADREGVRPALPPPRTAQLLAVRCSVPCWPRSTQRSAPSRAAPPSRPPPPQRPDGSGRADDEGPGRPAAPLQAWPTLTARPWRDLHHGDRGKRVVQRRDGDVAALRGQPVEDAAGDDAGVVAYEVPTTAATSRRRTCVRARAAVAGGRR